MSSEESKQTERKALPAETEGDPCSQANLTQVKMVSMHISLTPNFRTSQLVGYVDLGVELLEESKDVVLDTRSLDIKSASIEGKEATFTLTPHAVNAESFGSALAIAVPSDKQAKGATFVVRVHYNTTKESEAVQWLAKDQTGGKRHPFLFTQCQAIHARSLLPCQDTPQTKCAYTSEITVVAPLVCLMSAILTNKKMLTNAKYPSGLSTYSFEQKVPIPAYLIAIAVGDIEPRPIGDGSRTMVWAEREVVDAAAEEFSETEAFLDAAEAICGDPYLWGRYDLLVMPPSFPYGGMENPCLTFVTPTLLAGDRSLANVVAHEIAHSWTGNLVTNRNWEHFWLNEGFTVFVERKICARLSGAKAYGCASKIGVNDLEESIAAFSRCSHLTCMVPALDNIDPDDAFSSVPYEKGYNLLTYIEQLVGEEAFSSFLQAWVAKFKFKTATSKDFVEMVGEHFKDNQELASFDWHEWLYTPGMPHKMATYDTTYFDAAEALSSSWVAFNSAVARADQAAMAALLDGLTKGESASWSEWSAAYQKIPFLNCLLDAVQASPLELATLKALDTLYNLSASTNSEVAFRWQMVSLKSKDDAIVPHVVKFATSQGRMKFVRPLFRELNTFKPEVAKATFTEHRSMYHPIAVKMIANDLGL